MRQNQPLKRRGNNGYRRAALPQKNSERRSSRYAEWSCQAPQAFANAVIDVSQG
jgi:hypothetical protein